MDRSDETPLHVPLLTRGHRLYAAMLTSQAACEEIVGTSDFQRCRREVVSRVAPYSPKPLYEIERIAFWIYTSPDAWYLVINSSLRDGDDDWSILVFRKLLNGAISKLFSHSGFAYRGIRIPDVDAFVAEYSVGRTVEWPAFTSAAAVLEKAFIGNVLFIIEPRSGVTVGGHSAMPSEDEVLFPAGTRFVVTALERQGDDVVIELSEYRK